MRSPVQVWQHVFIIRRYKYKQCGLNKEIILFIMQEASTGWEAHGSCSAYSSCYWLVSVTVTLPDCVLWSTPGLTADVGVPPTLCSLFLPPGLPKCKGVEVRTTKSKAKKKHEGVVGWS